MPDPAAPALILSALYIYPIKSAGSISLASSRVEPRGLAHDRRWMVVDPAGRLVTQREFPRMRLIEVQLREGGLSVNAPGMPPLHVPAEPGGGGRQVFVWGDAVQAVSVSQAAAEWFSRYLGPGCDLVYLPDSSERWQPPERPYSSLLSFAEGNPFHLISEASLADLNAVLAGQPGSRPVTAQEFRPNLVVRGAAAYHEDYWRRLRVSGVSFEVVESCARCAVVNVTPQGQMTAEPLRTLARTRRRSGGVPFGQHLVQQGPPQERWGQLRVGDTLEVLEVAETVTPMY